MFFFFMFFFTPLQSYTPSFGEWWPPPLVFSLFLFFWGTDLGLSFKKLCPTPPPPPPPQRRQQHLRAELWGAVVAAAVVPLGNVLYPHCLVPRKGLTVVNISSLLSEWPGKINPIIQLNLHNGQQCSINIKYIVLCSYELCGIQIQDVRNVV